MIIKVEQIITAHQAGQRNFVGKKEEGILLSMFL